MNDLETRLEAYRQAEPESEAERQAAEVAKYDGWLGILRDVPEYPDHLRIPRRAAFVRQIHEYDAKSDGLWKSDPDTVDNPSRVTPEQDARNSRPAPY